MKRVYILCEGQTEERFIKEVMCPRFQNQEIYITPVILSTKRPASGGKYRGGVSTFSHIRGDLKRLCNDHTAMVTTMLDYYELPSDTPGMNERTGDLYSDIAFIEREIFNNIGEANLSVNLMVHEFESLLFSAPECFRTIADENAVNRLFDIVGQFATPEEINNSIQTAPSKRIQQIIPTYKKVLDGVAVAKAIGLDRMKESCPHFSNWIDLIYAG